MVYRTRHCGRASGLAGRANLVSERECASQEKFGCLPLGAQSPSSRKVYHMLNFKIWAHVQRPKSPPEIIMSAMWIASLKILGLNGWKL
jgi:hypothetical protein